jgi:hypothetical protein
MMVITTTITMMEVDMVIVNVMVRRKKHKTYSIRNFSGLIGRTYDILLSILVRLSNRMQFPMQKLYNTL